MTPKIKNLEREISKIKKDLCSLDGLRPGSLTTQFNTCGKKSCRCKANPPQKHGPYYQLSLSRKGKSKTKFIKQQAVEVIKKEIGNHRTLKELVERWIDLSIEISDLRIEELLDQAKKK